MAIGTNRTLALIGGAGFSLLGAVVVLLAVLGTRLAFDGAEHSASGSAEPEAIAIGAPEAAARSVERAARSVAAAPAPVAAASAVSSASAPVSTPSFGAVRGESSRQPAADAPSSPPLPAATPSPPNSGGVGKAGDQPDPGKAPPVDVGLEPILAPSGGVVDTTIGGLYKGLQPPLNDLTGNLVTALDTTLTGAGALLEGLGRPRD